MKNAKRMNDEAIGLPGMPSVALIVETSTSFGRMLLFGIAQYIREHSPWSLYFAERSIHESVPPEFRQWSGDGVISRSLQSDAINAIVNSGIPVVDLNEQLRGQGVPLITNDHDQIGQMAADHLLQRGFKRFAYVGYPGMVWSDARSRAFAHVVESAGHEYQEYPGLKKEVPGSNQWTWEFDLKDSAEWIKRLEKPIGVFVGSDFWAVQLLTACRMANAAVPEEVAVIGVGGDDVACELSNPPLSSVVLNAYRMGYESAALLDRQMKGEKIGEVELIIPPLEIVSRQSSDVTAIDDPVVARAMQYIRETACSGIKISDVLRHVVVSRSALQNHFRTTLGRSIHDVILSVRVNRVRELLANTNLSLLDIAERTGFKHAEHMSNVFRRRTQWTPAKYREEHGYKPPAQYQVNLPDRE